MLKLTLCLLSGLSNEAVYNLAAISLTIGNKTPTHNLTNYYKIFTSNTNITIATIYIN